MSYIQYLTYQELLEAEENLVQKFRQKGGMSQSELLRVCQEHREVRKAILDMDIEEECSTSEIDKTESVRLCAGK